jgi:hypothetical protein
LVPLVELAFVAQTLACKNLLTDELLDQDLAPLIPRLHGRATANQLTRASKATLAAERNQESDEFHADDRRIGLGESTLVHLYAAAVHVQMCILSRQLVKDCYTPSLAEIQEPRQLL